MAKVEYRKLLDESNRVLVYDCDFENLTRFTVQVVCYLAGPVGISIDRCGHFIFRGWKSLIIGPGNIRYMAEKLFIPESDSIQLAKFLKHIYETEIWTY